MAMIAIVYLTMALTKEHRREMEEFRKDQAQDRTAFMNFVEANNHQKTELVQESTAAIVEARKAIELHTKLLEQHVLSKK